MKNRNRRLKEPGDGRNASRLTPNSSQCRRSIPALLPEALRPWIMDEAERMPCPPDFIAATAIVMISSIVGARCGVRPKSHDSWIVVPNLWGGVVGLPSTKKSPAIGAAMKPLGHLIEIVQKIHENELHEYATKKAIHEAKVKAMEARLNAAVKANAAAKGGKGEDQDSVARALQELREEEPARPNVPRFKSNDSTIEKLGELLRDNPRGLLIVRDELVGLMASWEREGREGDRAFFLEAYNGDQSFDTDRIGRGHILIPESLSFAFRRAPARQAHRLSRNGDWGARQRWDAPAVPGAGLP